MSDIIDSGWMIQLTPEPEWQLYQVWPQSMTLIFTDGRTRSFCGVDVGAAEYLARITDGPSLLAYMNGHFCRCDSFRIVLENGEGDLLLQSGSYLLLEDAT